MAMTDTQQDRNRARLTAYAAAVCTQNYDRVAPFVANDIVWTIRGPVDMLPFCGVYRGKAEVQKLLSHDIEQSCLSREIAADTVVIEGDSGAVLGNLVAQSASGDAIHYRIAFFFVMRDGLVVDHCSLIDSFDAVEQVTGKRLHVAPGLVPGQGGREVVEL